MGTGNRVATLKTSFEGFLFVSVKLSFQVLCCISSIWMSEYRFLSSFSVWTHRQVDFDPVLSKPVWWPQRTVALCPVTVDWCLNTLIQANSCSISHWPVSVRNVCIWALFKFFFLDGVFCKSNTKCLGEVERNLLIKFLFRYQANSVNGRWSIKL